MIHFFIEGLPGIGKSRILQRLAENDNISCFPEPVDLWRNFSDKNILELLYEQPEDYTFFFQSLALMSFVEQSGLEVPPGNVVVQERSIHSCVKVFCNAAFQNGHLSSHEKALLDRWYTALLKKNISPTPSHTIYLKAPPEVCYERIQIRNRLEEKNIPFSYLHHLQNLHDEWLLGRSDVTVIDASRPPTLVVNDVLALIKRKNPQI